jgi:hypothetical protein
MLGTSVAKGWAATERIHWAQQFEQKLAHFNCWSTGFFA